MNAPLWHPLFRQCCAGLVLAAAWCTQIPARASGLSGNYDDEGVIAASGSEEFPLGVSLHALISLEFDPGMARQLHDQTARVNVRHRNGRLEVRVYDRHGAVIREGRWQKDTTQGARAYLLFRVKDDNYLFNFESVSEQRLLQVTVQHSTPTSFGPAWRSVGTFLFPRIL